MLFENNDYADMHLNLNDFQVMPLNNYNKGIMPLNNEEPSVGYLRGNMFDNLYDPYKNYQVKMPKVVGQRNKMLFKIMEYAFMINDYNLYLDLHPDDKEIFNKFKKASSDMKMLVTKYENMYGPLELEDTEKGFDWIKNPWPWDREDGYYV